MEKIVIAKGDDLTAFGHLPILIELSADSETEIQNFLQKVNKLVLRIGTVYKEFTDLQFPLELDITAEESLQLREENTGYMIAYDKYGKRLTLEGTLEIDTTPDVMNVRSDYDTD